MAKRSSPTTRPSCSSLPASFADLSAVIAAFVAPLCERFDGYQPSGTLIAAQVNELHRRRRSGGRMG